LPWRNEIGVLLVKVEKFLLIGRQTEKIGRLLHPFHFRAGRGEALSILLRQLSFVEIGLVANRVPALVRGLKDIAIVAGGHLLPDCLRRLAMTILGGAD